MNNTLVSANRSGADCWRTRSSILLMECFAGEVVYVVLYGAAIDTNVRLEKNTIRIDNTYISMANQKTVTIHNRSNVIAHFKWSPLATQEEEDSQKERYDSQAFRGLLLHQVKWNVAMIIFNQSAL